MQLISTLRSDLSTAMKARDSAKVKLIRSLLDAIDNASAVPAMDTVEAVGIYEGDARVDLSSGSRCGRYSRTRSMSGTRRPVSTTTSRRSQGCVKR
jgi:hypothetical protein